MQINNQVLLTWEVEDPIYPYQGTYTYSPEEFQKLNLTEVKKQQEAEYTAWLEQLKAIEQGQ